MNGSTNGLLQILSVESYSTVKAIRIKKVLKNALTKLAEIAIAIQHGAWSGNVPYLCLLLCIADNDCAAFLKQNEVKNRKQLDAMKCPV